MNESRIRRTWAGRSAVASLLAIAGAAGPSSAAPVDFERDIQPILRASCVQCHGPDVQEAGLRLDQRREAARGGTSGLPILGGTLETNELWRRVRSDDPAYRMPRHEPPLPEDRLELLRRWVEAGTPWPDRGVPEQAAQPTVWMRSYERGIEPALPLLLLVFVVALALEHLRRRPPRRMARLAGMTGKVRLVHAVVVAAVLVSVHQFMATGELQARYDAMIETEDGYFGNPPVPRRPDHERRLRGTYYRGNCERHQRLFNGGNYRTCSLRVDLVDSGGQPVEYGDPWPDGGLFIRFDLDRAANTTPNLFQDRLMRGVLLTEHVLPPGPADLDLDRTVFLDEVEPMWRWSATVPVAPRGNGLIYVYRADVSPQRDATTSAPIAHYAIRYDLREDDGRVARASEVWLGALYVNTRVSPPPMEGRIPFDSWFSDRPIPEIEGEPVRDPELLGEPEHLAAGEEKAKPPGGG